MGVPWTNRTALDLLDHHRLGAAMGEALAYDARFNRTL
jgi:hypothetical protein